MSPVLYYQASDAELLALTSKLATIFGVSDAERVDRLVDQDPQPGVSGLAASTTIRRAF